MKKYEILIIIPARSGSKQIKNKNLVKINKHPLISYSIAAAHKIKVTKKIIFCSTDSKKIKNIAANYGATIPFLRPKKISGNKSRDLEFVNHSLINFFKNNKIFKFGLILRPTSPIRKASSLNFAYKKFKSNPKMDSMRAITPSYSNPFKSWFINKNFLKNVITKSKIHEHYNAPRQILPKTYYQTGNFEFFKINYRKKLKSISQKNIGYFKVIGPECIDIDKKKDFKHTQKLINSNKFIVPKKLKIINKIF